MIRLWSGKRPVTWEPGISPELAKARLDEEIRRFRSSPEHEALKELKRTTSMLHEDVLIILRYLARVTPGAILELGPYVGGSTISIAMALGRPRRFITVEKGGAHDHPHLPSEDILADLRKNLARHGVADRVRIIEGHNDAAGTVQAVRAALGPEKIGLFVIDSDGKVERDFGIYGPLCLPGCVLVVDDYVSEEVERKSSLIKPYVDGLVAEGRLVPIGRYGWYDGTWMGRLA